MRVAVPNALSRRALLAISSLAVFTKAPPTVAKVDGIPLYAPGEEILLPKAGFEYWLPVLSALKEAQLPTLRAAVGKSDWQTAARFVTPEAIEVQLKTFGSMASILGDDAYTAIGIKQRYGKAIKQLQSVVVADTPSETTALEVVSSLEACASELYALVPTPVIEQVKAREAAIRNLKAAEEAAAAPRAEAPQ